MNKKEIYIIDFFNNKNLISLNFKDEFFQIDNKIKVYYDLDVYKEGNNLHCVFKKIQYIFYVNCYSCDKVIKKEEIIKQQSCIFVKKYTNEGSLVKEEYLINIKNNTIDISVFLYDIFNIFFNEYEICNNCKNKYNYNDKKN